MELDSRERESPGEIKRREVELDSHSWMEYCLAAELFARQQLLLLFSDTVFVTLFRTAVETAVSEAYTQVAYNTI